MLKWAKTFFKTQTIEEAEEAGRLYVERTLKNLQGLERKAMADHIAVLALGGFDMTPNSKAFDRGCNDKLRELGYEY